MFTLLKRKKKTIFRRKYPLRSCKEFLDYMIAGSYILENKLVDNIMVQSGHKDRNEIVDLVRTTRNALPKN